MKQLNTRLITQYQQTTATIQKSWFNLRNHIISTNSHGVIAYNQNLILFNPGDFIFIPKQTEVRIAIHLPQANALEVTMWRFVSRLMESNQRLHAYLVARQQVQNAPIGLKSKEYILEALENDLDAHVRYQSKDSQNRLSIQERLLLLIREDLRHQWSVEEVCKRLYLSRSKLFRQLKADNLTFTEILNIEKLEAAKHMLSSTAMSVDQISYQCGFSSQSYFGKKFRRRFGVSPSKFRKS
ncbi:helix-turn-helix transcriptional regulator [Vibrio ponticus]|uniref:helix-turn-helix transcriptional regulator n=1 Tax=Vibrio ponticus TaxID=265668 RepID=UPI0009F8BAAA|nr:AraC family transcriptional regulator [Vibrio ponticus]